jgi:hypothetical protein
MSIIRYFVFLGLFALATGCRAPKPAPTSSALVGFRTCFSQDPAKLDTAIRDDYQDYINGLPHELRIGVGPIDLLEDGSGRHAVRIPIALNGTDWAHVLIYDKDNKRVRVVKFVSGHYSS